MAISMYATNEVMTRTYMYIIIYDPTVHPKGVDRTERWTGTDITCTNKNGVS